jgi:hypothetical protein
MRGRAKISARERCTTSLEQIALDLSRAVDVASPNVWRYKNAGFVGEMPGPLESAIDAKRTALVCVEGEGTMIPPEEGAVVEVGVWSARYAMDLPHDVALLTTASQARRAPRASPLYSR